MPNLFTIAVNSTSAHSKRDTTPLSYCACYTAWLTGFHYVSPCPHQQGFKGFQVAPESHHSSVPFQFNGTEYALSHGSVVIAAITSCTNTSNPSVMLGAGT